MAGRDFWNHLVCLALLTFVAQGALCESISDADQADILNCVTSVLSDEKVGFIKITGGSGFSLLNGFDPVVAGGRIGKGRVIGAGHAKFLKPEEDSDKNSDRKTFLTNVFQWLNNGNPNPAKAALLTNGVDNAEIAEALKQYFGQVDTIAAGDIGSTKVDVIVFAGNMDVNDAPKLKERVEQGTGLFISATSWNYTDSYANPDEFNAWVPNKIALEAGFTFRHSKNEQQQYAGNGGDQNKLWSALKDKYSCEKDRKMGSLNMLFENDKMRLGINITPD